MSITVAEMVYLNVDKCGIALILDALAHGSTRDEFKALAAHVPDNFGWESIRAEGDSSDEDPIAYYLNMGDTYETTVVYDWQAGEYHVTSYGDWLEAWEREQQQIEADNAIEQRESDWDFDDEGMGNDWL